MSSRRLALKDLMARFAARRIYQWHLLNGTDEEPPKEILDLMKGPPGSLGGKKRRTIGRSTTDATEPDGTKEGKKLRQHSTHIGGPDARTIGDLKGSEHGVQTGSWKDQPDRVDLTKELADPKFIPSGAASSRPWFSLDRDAQSTAFLSSIWPGEEGLIDWDLDIWYRDDLDEMCRHIDKGDEEALQDFADSFREVTWTNYRRYWRWLGLSGPPRKPRTLRVSERQERRRRQK